MKRFYIIDGYGIIFRAFYALPPLQTTSGMHVGAVYGFLKILLSIIHSESPPEYLAIAFDTGGRTFRDDIFDSFTEAKMIKELYLLYGNKLNQISLDNLLLSTFDDCKETLAIHDNQIEDFESKFNVKVTKAILLLIYLGIQDQIEVSSYESQYKANRKETPQELKSQFAIIRELIESLHIPIVMQKNYEADDVIASYVKMANQHDDVTTVVVSSDKDLIQLVNDKTTIYDPAKKKAVNIASVQEAFSFHPSKFSDYLAIIGDTADNVPGVKGIGPKGAVKLINSMHSIENIINNLHAIDDQKIKSLIENNIDMLQLSHELVKLKHDLETLDIEHLCYKNNFSNLKAFTEKYEFRNLWKNYKEQQESINQPSLF